MGRSSDAKPRLICAVTKLIWEKSYGAVTIDDICQQAEVKKGSFYYFYKSKAELVADAIEHHWQQKKDLCEAMFSRSTPPLERFRQYFDFMYQRQVNQKTECGQVLGCLFASIGSEVVKEELVIGEKIRALMTRYTQYFETALEDAMAEGLIPQQDVKNKAQALFAYVEGMLTQARIQNDPEVFKSLTPIALSMIGFSAPELATV